MKKLSTIEFINKAVLVHGKMYSYDKTIYEGSKKKILIICKVHGGFFQSPNSHLRGDGCKKCSREKIGTDEFIKRSISIHGDRYNYSRSKYIRRRDKVLIICKKHGEFFQSPDSHYRGRGCPMCANMYPKKYGQNGLTLYDTYAERLIGIGVYVRRGSGDKNVLEVKCHSCGKWHAPKSSEVADKLSAAYGVKGGENNIYCSNKCKEECPTFNHQSIGIDPRSKLYVDKTEQEFARNCQTNHLKIVQCDRYGKMYCEKCGNEIFNMDAELHHTLDISTFGKDAINSSGHIILCANCHIITHSECG